MKYVEKNIGDFKGQDVYEIKLINDCGNSISFWTLGARINRFDIKDIGNIVMSYKNVKELVNNRNYYFGATIGRVAGRISAGKFELNGKSYRLVTNEGANHLHGGINGYDLRNFSYKIVDDKSEIKIIFSLMDKETHNYYPGNLEFEVIHSFNNNNEWIVEYRAMADKDTLINPTNHVYFNLNGKKSTINNHLLRIPADKILETKEDGIPIGGKESIKNTDIDFTDFRNLSEVFASDHPEILKYGGLDTPFLLNGENLILYSPDTKIRLNISTDRDSAIIYTLNKVDKDSNMDLLIHQAIAIETQSLPDAINHDDFGNIVLKKDERFYSTTKYGIVISEWWK